ELDFGEEDVEFADRSQLKALVNQIEAKLSSLINSFQLGNALKQGVATVIMGKPNAGKSTLLNALLNDNRAIVSEIPGTTRDVIEDRVIIEGIEFRLIDTAGVRETQDVIEAEGVSRTLAAAQKAQLLIYLFDLTEESVADATAYVADLGLPEQTQFLIIGNKVDLIPPVEGVEMGSSMGINIGSASTSTGIGMSIGPMVTNHLNICAQSGEGLTELRQRMVDAVHMLSSVSPDQTLISNVRHLNALQQAYASLKEVQQGLESGLTGDLLTIDIRRVLHFIGEITGEITTDEVLGNIFGKFCIGK
ncbi:MAG: GTPase, partial [Bacteroidota bacterium]